ncbi:heme peroxidase [Xylariaceae sp. FL0662B]|nr:heme peroxidase [Xylariaceae sp. FL0662B]
MRVSSGLVSLLGAATPSLAMFYYPNPAVSLLEHILVDNWGAYASNFSSAITPCTRYVTWIGEAADNSGRTTSAQWMRVAFHDFVTADVEAATGGMDASIGFETFREENKGVAFNDSFTFWRPFVNEYVPMADLVALGTVMAVHLCGGHYIPFKPGRIDASSADPTTGVPEPNSSVEEMLSEFERSGFDQESAIGLTACGHTLGSVHNGGFPEVVDNSTISPTNLEGGSNFDTTRGNFDPLVVHEYIDWIGNKGGALVTSFNETSRSDLRLYESDANATMQKLYSQGDGFGNTCVDLLERMIDTVPSSVQLQDAISPFLIKPVNVTWDVTNDNQLIISGRIRLLHAGPIPKGRATITFSNGYQEILDPEPETGFSAFKLGADGVNATTQFLPFSVPSSRVSGARDLAISAPGFETQIFAIQDNAFIVPSLTRVSDDTISITLAARRNNTDLDPSQLTVKVATPVTQLLTLGPRILDTDLKLEQAESPLSDFSYWSGSALIGTPTGDVSVTVLSGDEVVDRLLLDAGVAGW